jgi:hypothetical protein
LEEPTIFSFRIYRILYAEGGVAKLLRNISAFLPDHMTYHPGRQ